MSTEMTEPAVPVLAAVPIKSLKDLLDTVERDVPLTRQDGVGVKWHIDTRGVSVVATMSIHDWDSSVLATRTYDGQWEVGGLIRWSPRQ